MQLSKLITLVSAAVVACCAPVSGTRLGGIKAAKDFAAAEDYFFWMKILGREESMPTPAPAPATPVPTEAEVLVPTEPLDSTTTSVAETTFEGGTESPGTTSGTDGPDTTSETADPDTTTGSDGPETTPGTEGPDTSSGTDGPETTTTGETTEEITAPETSVAPTEETTETTSASEIESNTTQETTTSLEMNTTSIEPETTMDTSVSETTTEANSTTSGADSTTTESATATEASTVTDSTTLDITETTESETTSPAGDTCDIEATAECIFDNDVPCSDLELISADEATCILANGPMELGWIYRGSNCDDSDTDFVCEDSDGGPDGNPLVNILIENAAGEELFQEFGVSLDEAILIPSSSDAAIDDEMSVIIFIGGDETDGVLQTMVGIKTGCTDGDDLMLGRNYGALEFVSYRNDDDELIQAVQPVEWRYSVVNVGATDALLTEVESDTNGETLTQNPDTELESQDSFSFTVPGEINLLTAGSYTGQVSAVASPVSADGVECGDAASSTIDLS